MREPEDPRGSGGGPLTGRRSAAVFTHRRPDEVGPALEALFTVAHQAGVELRLDPSETRKHGLSPRPGLVLDAPFAADVEICFALGGDGTILTALRRYAGTGVPVFGVNFGEIGFLATVDRENYQDGFRRALSREFDVLALPGIALSGDSSGLVWKLPERIAINDVSIQRQQGKRVASLSYAIGADEIGRVRCDGLVVSTPAGSTGYNLANGGPVMAWGVEGYVVSFIAPHSLTARALVVAPGDELTIVNRSPEDPVDIALDGRPAASLAPGGVLGARFVPEQGLLAQLAGINFYERLGQKFGRLTSPPA